VGGLGGVDQSCSALRTMPRIGDVPPGDKEESGAACAKRHTMRALCAGATTAYAGAAMERGNNKLPRPESARLHLLDKKRRGFARAPQI